MPAERILILAGTSEARDLANALVEKGRDVITSFAGVTKEPLLPKGRVHRGGFGGMEGLVAFLRQETVTHVVDATHPFAAQMSAHAHAACGVMNTPLVRLERPAWIEKPDDHWIAASSLVEAAQQIPASANLLVTTGRKSLEHFFARGDLSGVIRTIEPPQLELPSGWTVLLDRPPHSLEAELLLMRSQGITCVVSKNAGGASTGAKIDAARQLGLPVVMIARPTKPPCRTVSTEAEALLGIIGEAG